MQKDDVIYRQVAIDAIDECFKKVVRAGNMSAYEYDNAYTQGEIDAYVTAIDTVKTLPAVQLEQVCVATVTLTDEQVKEAVEKAKNAVISVIEPELHWIPCSERLPEENGQYLITVRYKHVDGYEDVYAEHGDWCDGNWDMFCFGHCGEVESILAWMPLPIPYCGGGNGE